MLAPPVRTTRCRHGWGDGALQQEAQETSFGEHVHLLTIKHKLVKAGRGGVGNSRQR